MQTNKAHPLHDLRVRAKRTVAEVARLSGITEAHWRRIGRLKSGVHASTVFGLEVGLNATIEEIMERLRPKP